MGRWCRTQTREEKKHSTGATASHLMAAQPAIWFLQQGSCGQRPEAGASPSRGQGT